jgi:hypothetical protein
LLTITCATAPNAVEAVVDEAFQFSIAPGARYARAAMHATGGLITAHEL